MTLIYYLILKPSCSSISEDLQHLSAKSFLFLNNFKYETRKIVQILNKSDRIITMCGGAALVPPPHSGYTASRSGGVRMCGECEQQSRADKAVSAAYTVKSGQRCGVSR